MDKSWRNNGVFWRLAAIFLALCFPSSRGFAPLHFDVQQANHPLMEQIFTFDTGVTLLGGGAVDPVDLQQALALAPPLVAADGGGDSALALGHSPDAVIGDLDSLSATARTRLGDRVHHVAEQDSTDFGKCLDRVIAPFYLALGFSGKRLDHTLAALSELARRPAQKIMLVSEDDVIFLCPDHFAIDLPVGVRFSLFPFGVVRGRSLGLNWPIDGIEMSPATRVGTSNMVNGPVQIWVEGPMLVLIPKEHLSAVLSVW